MADARQQEGATTSPPSASGDAPPPETLRQVADEVRAAFPRPLSAPELVLIDVDPRRVHAFWTLSPATVDAARRELARTGENDAPMVLRIHPISAGGGPGEAFDVEVVGLQGRCYVDVWGEARCYRGELGLRQSDGSLVSLAASTIVELPPLGPADDDAPVTPAEMPGLPERVEEQARPGPPSEPVRHPFPLPPSEPSDFVPDYLAPQAAVVMAASVAAQQPAVSEPAPPPTWQPAAAWQEPPEPVRHPFPLPPMEVSEFDPRALMGGFLPPLEAAAEATTPEAGADTSPAHQGAGPEAQPAGEAHAPNVSAERPSASEGETSGPLPLENVLTLSSYALGRETVEFEVSAELHIFGRARPGTQLQLFGRKVPLRPDGTFSVIRPLPSGALILSSLLVGDGEHSGD
jgi:hypothetical protein